MIVIDPGHGEIDNGTKAASGEMEKTIVLDFCLLLRDRIERTGKYRVAMTRTDDSFVALADRVGLARARQAALFISVHADALARGEGDAQGATVYTLSERPSDARAARLAATENQADIIAGLDLSSEPKDIAGIPARSRPPRDQDVFSSVRAGPCQRNALGGPAAPASLEISELCGAQGSRHSIRSGGAGVRIQQG